ncbi:hypothetical protein B0H11DRAFT_2046005 [Mycena galericulata]|nr:hypothetical protein B0H11DRAFT_2046005 [Mycena galericulata]
MATQTSVGCCQHCSLYQPPTADSLTDSSVHLDRAHLRRRIAQLNTLIATLDTERQCLQAQSDSIIYPVLTLPPELTSVIFIHCLPSPTSQPSPLEAPLLLAQICRQWREIAVSIPELWHSLFLSDRHPLAGELFSTWISRSGHCPLNFSFTYFDSDHASALIDACKPYADRWQDVDLLLPYLALKRLNDFPTMLLLRRISLSFRRTFPVDVDGVSGDPIIILDAPLLREAVIGTFPTLKFALPWRQLTSLTLTKIDAEDCFAILDQCPDLVTLDLTTNIQAPPLVDLPTVLLASLESLTFPSGFCFVIDHLRLPRLAHIYIRETIVVGPDPANVLQRFIGRSSPPLRHFSLLLKYPASETFGRCLEALPTSITALDLHCGNATNVSHVLAVLREPTTLPQLRSLSIAGGRVFDHDYADIADVLQVRGGGALKSFALLVQTYGRMDAERDGPRQRVMPRFRALAETGMGIRFTVTGKMRVGTEVLMDTS